MLLCIHRLFDICQLSRNLFAFLVQMKQLWQETNSTEIYCSGCDPSRTYLKTDISLFLMLHPAKTLNPSACCAPTLPTALWVRSHHPASKSSESFDISLKVNLGFGNPCQFWFNYWIRKWMHFKKTCHKERMTNIFSVPQTSIWSQWGSIQDLPDSTWVCQGYRL